MTIIPLNAHMKNHIVVIRKSHLPRQAFVYLLRLAVVCFISDVNLIASLQRSPEEVDYIFTHPLKGCHTGTLEGKDLDGLTEKGGKPWPYDEEFYVSPLCIAWRAGPNQRIFLRMLKIAWE